MIDQRLWCAWCGKWGDHQSWSCPNIMNIFELVDVTDEEHSFTKGVFLSLDAVIATVECMDEPWRISDHAFDVYCTKLEVRKRKVGELTNHYDVVKKWHWAEEYFEDTDENKWVLKEAK